MSSQNLYYPRGNDTNDPFSIYGTAPVPKRMNSPPPKVRLLGVPDEPPAMKRMKLNNPRPERISNENRQVLNMASPPHVDWMEYTPNEYNSSILVNTSRGFNYKNEAIKKMANAWSEYCKDKANCDEIMKSECKKHGVNYSIFKNRLSQYGGRRKTLRVRKNTTARKSRKNK
jgi:hypothetical protein